MHITIIEQPEVKSIKEAQHLFIKIPQNTPMALPRGWMSGQDKVWSLRGVDFEKNLRARREVDREIPRELAPGIVGD
jgi:hypothetical protein